jgi:hypothetical protein
MTALLSNREVCAAMNIVVRASDCRGAAGGCDSGCLASLLSLDHSEHPDPRPRLYRLAGDRRGTGIPPCHGGGLPAVNVNHVAREFVLVGTIRHHHHLVARPVPDA